MRAFVIDGPGRGRVREVEPPIATAGLVVVDVARVGLCGTDVELFTGEMAYLHTGQAAYPIRIGHEWCGTVRSVGPGVDEAWVGRRVTGDTMLGCGRCDRCRGGRQYLCADRFEVGIRNGWSGALAERLAVPATSLLALPDAVDDTRGALVEPGGNAWRALEAAEVGPGERLLVLGAGAIGLLVALMARAAGVDVHLLAHREPSVRFAAVARLRARLDCRDAPVRAVRRGGGCLERRPAAGPRDRPRRARPARGLDRAVGDAQPRRQPPGRVQGRHGRSGSSAPRPACTAPSTCSPPAAWTRRPWSPRSSASTTSRACSAGRGIPPGGTRRRCTSTRAADRLRRRCVGRRRGRAM